ncbi:GDSL-like Lipase/Acylhydrolase-domain-containing protein [Syncephalis plumigaleata]|nr:GDSL-like Lipase/Acylhydrolase-domain-containing protein [Syncephalis plumigaleata]
MYLLPSTLLAVLAVVHQAMAGQSANVTNFDQCPKLAPRVKAAAHVRDLRYDDIKVVMALGDSITAGFSAKPKSFLDVKRIFEFRGVSYAIGGDPGAVTLPNGFRRYQPDLIGASVGDHLVEVCYGPICPPFQYQPEQDRLNAAQSGAMAQNLKKEVYYLLDQLHANQNVNMKNDWKFLNLQVGSNDLCLACTPFAKDRGPLSADAYESYIREALQTIRTNIPRVFVNLLGNFKVSEIYAHGQKRDHCKIVQSLPGFNIACACALVPGPLGDKLRAEMDDMMDQYNERLRRIYEDYERIKDPQFAVSLQLFETKLTTFPVDTFSNFDCFHPTEKTHAYIAKFAWNGLSQRLSDRPGTASYNPNMTIRCPTDDDRLRTD